MQSQDPRSRRARKFITQAFLDLLREKPYRKITIKEIVNRADLARPTFYSHYETKDDLLNSVIDAVMDQFFDSVGDWDSLSAGADSERKIGIKFFKLWQENAEILNLLETVNLDFVLIDRFKSQFKKYYDQQGMKNMVGLEPPLANYIISFNAYSFVSILRQWIDDDMRYPPEVIGQLLFHFTNPSLKNEAFTKFNQFIR